MTNKLPRRRRWAVGFTVALLSATASLAVPAGALPPPGDPGDPGDPPIPPCMENTRVNSMSVNRRSTFGVSTVRFSWNITKGCPVLVLSVDGQTVPAVGSMDVSVPTSRRLTVRGQFGAGGSATYNGPFVVAGRFIRYTQQANGRLGPGQAGGSSGYPNVDASARLLIDKMVPAHVNNFAGTRIDVHVFPRNGHTIDELPPWDQENPAKFANLCGKASSEEDSAGRYSIAVGVDPAQGCIDRKTVIHELGHAVLAYADEDVVTAATDARAEHLRTPNAPWVGCDDAYSRSSVHEYWAEGTAAFFDRTTPSCAEYTHAFLATTDPPLHEALHQVFNV